MITIRTAEWRIRSLLAERRLDRARSLLGHLGAASQRTVQIGKGLRREVVKAYASRPTAPPARNPLGRLLPEATVATEDANFWHEPGIDMQGIVRAAWIDWRHQQPVQGASTITQQLVKLRLIGSEVSVTRKIKEAILAVQLEHIYTKK